MRFLELNSVGRTAKKTQTHYTRLLVVSEGVKDVFDWLQYTVCSEISKMISLSNNLKLQNYIVMIKDNPELVDKRNTCIITISGFVEQVVEIKFL